MMIEEFQKLTGFYPDSELYCEIESIYNDFDGDKVEFAKAFKKNEKGIAEAARNCVNESRWRLLDGFRNERESWEREKKQEQDAWDRERKKLIFEKETAVDNLNNYREATRQKEEEQRQMYNAKVAELAKVKKELEEIKAAFRVMGKLLNTAY